MVALLFLLSTRRLTSLIVDDAIFDAAREAVWRNHPPNRIGIGYFLTCRQCTSVWAGLVTVLLSRSNLGRVVLVALALSEATIEIDELIGAVKPKSLEF